MSGAGSRPIVAIFGSAAPDSQDELYRRAESAGRHLAIHGFAVVTGGFSGVMEGAGKGAFEAGGESIGVISTIFSSRDPNPYLTRVIDSQDLHERTQLLIEHAAAFVILDGQAGTLSELSFLWALHRAGCLDDRPVILLGDYWGPLVNLCRQSGYLGAEQLEATHQVAAPRDLAPMLEKLGLTGAPSKP